MYENQEQNQQLLKSVDQEIDGSYIAFIRSEENVHDIGTYRKRKILGCAPWAVHLTVFVLYIIFYFTQRPFQDPDSKKWDKVDWSYVYSGLEINNHFHETSLTSPFQGRPNVASEEAWHHMLSVGIVSITKEEKSRLPFDTAPNVFKKDEYVVELNIFHQLHCLHGLRQQLYKPRHLSWQNDEPVTFWEFHMNHCIEHLRETLMCNADITPQRFEWDDENFQYMLDQKQEFSQCKNWADIWTWAEDRNTTGDTPTNVGEVRIADTYAADVGKWWEASAISS